MTPDGRRAYVVNAGSGDVSVIDLLTDTVSATVPVAGPASVLGVFVGAVVPAVPDPPGSEDVSPTGGASPGSAPGVTGGSGASAGLGSLASAGATSGATLHAGTPRTGLVATGGNPLAPNGSITGTVTRSDTNDLLQGASVTVFDVFTGGQVGGAISTLADGTYTTPVLTPGIYRIRARLANFATTWFSDARSSNEGDIITVTATAPSIADIAMPPGAGVTDGISGTVTNVSNAPLVGVTIDLFDANNNFIESVTTGGEGTYGFQRRMAPGAYKVRARAPNFVTTFNSGKHTFGTADLVPAQAGSDVTANFTLAAGADIQGEVRDAANNLLAGAFIDVYEAGTFNFIEGAFVTNASGAYTTESRLPAGTYILRARRGNSGASVGITFYDGKRGFATADTVTVAAAQTVTGKNIQMTTGAAITGTITDGVNPIPGAQIDLVDATTPSALTSTFFAFTFRANANGFFDTGPQFPTAGSYMVRARFPGKIDTFYHAGADTGRDLFTATAIGAPGVANIAMPAGGTIKGTIRERGTNLPLPGVPVNTFRFRASALSGAFTVLTDLNGDYTIRGLDDGEWVVRADAPGHINAYYSGDADNPATDMQTATPVAIGGPGSEVTNVNLNLATGGGTVRGLVTRQDNGQPVPAGTTVQLRVYPRMNFILNAQVSSFDLCPGALTPCNFSVPNQAPGEYALEAFGSAFESETAIGWYQAPPANALGLASRGTALPVTIASTATANFQMPTPAGGARTISGFVKDETGAPITLGGDVGAFDPGSTSSSRFVNLNADGSFFLNHLLPGKYFVRAGAEKNYKDGAHGLDTTNGLPGQPYAEPVLSGAALIDVTAGDVAGLEIRLPGNPGTIAGTISRVCPPGDPTGCTAGTLVGIMGASVSVQNFFGNGVTGAITRADGSYLVRGLTPGSYKVRVSAPGPGFITRFYRCDVPPCATSTGTGLTFADGSFIPVAAGQQVSNINATLDPGGGSITGTVRGPSNVPVVGAAVQAREAASGATVFTTLTATDGTYSILQLATGTYKLRVFSNAPGFATEWYDGEPTQVVSDPVSVTAPNTTAGVDFLVATNEGSFSGQVFDSTGAPVAGAGVAAFDTTGGFVRATGVAGRDGKFTLLGLAPGTYIAQARAAGYAITFFGGVPNVDAATPIAVQSDTPGTNFTLFASGDITGTVSYSGQQTGAVNVGLFSDPGLTNRLYNLTLPSPGVFKFSKSPPDTQGLLPGTYYVGAFIDNNPNGVQDASEAHGQFGAAVVVGEGQIKTGIDVALVDGMNLGTTSVAESTPQVIVDPSSGNPNAGLGSVKISENATGTLSLAGRIQITLPQGLTFLGMPAVSTAVSNGLKIWQEGPSNPATCTGSNVPAVDLAGRRVSFALCQRSTAGPATIAPGHQGILRRSALQAPGKPPRRVSARRGRDSDAGADYHCL